MTAKENQVLDESQLSSLFESAVTESGTFGAQLSIIKDDQQLDFAAGVADAESGSPMTVQTLIQIGSITKLFNAMIIAALAEEGVIELDTPVKTYFSSFAVADRGASEAL